VHEGDIYTEKRAAKWAPACEAPSWPCKPAFPEMKARGKGRIVLTSSIKGPFTGYRGWAHYTQAGVSADAVARELGKA
jgi:NAD(P)-dependent dehydrogenase (short-subunit alcohol dehydrogenase family)